MRELEWKRFEQITEAYFNRIGWRTRPARIGPDGGVDIYLYKPDTTKVAAVVQCKAWNRYKVGVKPVRELYGIMAAESVSQGYFVTSGEYTLEALSFVQGKNITLIDGSALIERIRALPKEFQEELHRMATDGDYKTPTCPRCGRKMVRRIGEKGRGAGMPFWGCPAYPRCQAVLNMKNEADWIGGLSSGFFSLLR
jgi:restriction system protein